MKSGGDTKEYEFQFQEPNIFQMEAGIVKVIILKNVHLPFVPASMPRAFLWAEDTYELDGVLLPHPDDWCNVAPAAPEAAVLEDFISWEEASPTKKLKAEK